MPDCMRRGIAEIKAMTPVIDISACESSHSVIERLWLNTLMDIRVQTDYHPIWNVSCQIAFLDA